MPNSKNTKGKSGPKKTSSRITRTSKGKSSIPKRVIPPPPGPEASWEEQCDYLDKYDFVEREKAGYVREVTEEEERVFDEIAESARVHLHRERGMREMTMFLDPPLYLILEKVAKRRRMWPAQLAERWLGQRIAKQIRADERARR
jgi:hypothetical protein